MSSESQINLEKAVRESGDKALTEKFEAVNGVLENPRRKEIAIKVVYLAKERESGSEEDQLSLKVIIPSKNVKLAPLSKTYSLECKLNL